jgi:hypothetical protein
MKVGVNFSQTECGTDVKTIGEFVRVVVFSRPRPPSNNSVWPVMDAAPGPARKHTASATSAGVAKRRNGMRSSISFRASGSAKAWRREGVSTVPGAMAFTRMPYSARSIASIRVIWIRAAFDMP